MSNFCPVTAEILYGNLQELGQQQLVLSLLRFLHCKEPCPSRPSGAHTICIQSHSAIELEFISIVARLWSKFTLALGIIISDIIVSRITGSDPIRAKALEIEFRSEANPPILQLSQIKVKLNRFEMIGGEAATRKARVFKTSSSWCLQYNHSQYINLSNPFLSTLKSVNIKRVAIDHEVQ